MKHKPKSIKIKWGTWLKLRRSFKGITGETFDQYINRISEYLR